MSGSASHCVLLSSMKQIHHLLGVAVASVNQICEVIVISRMGRPGRRRLGHEIDEFDSSVPILVGSE